MIPAELGELPLLRGFDDVEVLGELARRFGQREFEPGEVLAVLRQPGGHSLPDRARQGRARSAPGPTATTRYSAYWPTATYFGDQCLTAADGIWEFTARP